MRLGDKNCEKKKKKDKHRVVIRREEAEIKFWGDGNLPAVIWWDTHVTLEMLPCASLSATKFEQGSK